MKNIRLLHIILSSLLIIFILNSCTKQEEIKNNNLSTHVKKSISENSIRSKAFDETIKKLRNIYPIKYELDTREAGDIQTSCGPDDDPQIECAEEAVTLPLPIPGTQVVYHPSLPPMDCGLVVQMDAIFCKNKGIDNSVITFTNFEFLSFITPVSDLCIDWLIAYNQLPYLERAEVYQKIVADYEAAYELLFMQSWVSDPNNDFDPCPEDGSACSSSYTAYQARYYKSACTKVCLVYDRDCDREDQVLGFLCQKEIPCYSDGCCKKETGYCMNSETGEVEVCHEAYYLVGECTNPIPNDPCFIELKPCDTTPNCIEE